MKPVHLVAWFAFSANAMLVAQSNTALLISQPATSKVSVGLSKPDPKTQGNLLRATASCH